MYANVLYNLAIAPLFDVFNLLYHTSSTVSVSMASESLFLITSFLATVLDYPLGNSESIDLDPTQMVSTRCNSGVKSGSTIL